MLLIGLLCSRAQYFDIHLLLNFNLANHTCNITVCMLSLPDLQEVVALFLLPCLLPPPLIQRCEQADIDGEQKRRKRNWKPTFAIMMQAFIILVPVSKTSHVILCMDETYRVVTSMLSTVSASLSVVTDDETGVRCEAKTTKQ
jgi:hypothetical protein